MSWHVGDNEAGRCDPTSSQQVLRRLPPDRLESQYLKMDGPVVSFRPGVCETVGVVN